MQFLACLRLCYGLYCEARGADASESLTDDIELFATRGALLDGIPFLHNYRSVAELLASTLKAGDVHRLVAQIRFLEASDRQYPGAVKQEGLADLRSRLERLRLARRDESGHAEGS